MKSLKGFLNKSKPAEVTGGGHCLSKQADGLRGHCGTGPSEPYGKGSKNRLEISKKNSGHTVPLRFVCFVRMHVCTPCACLVPVEVRRG